jgi:hypothetical protein
VNLPGSAFTHLAGISNAGRLAGYYDDSSGGTHGFTSSGGVFPTINVPDAASTCASGVNAFGTLIGYCLASARRSPGVNVSPK